MKLLFSVGMLFLLTSCGLFEPPQSPVSWETLSPVHFPSTNFWYQKIASNAELDPASQSMINLLSNTRENSTPYALIGNGGVSVFDTDSKTPRYNVPNTVLGYEKNGIKNVPIPDYALPADEQDSHTVFLDKARGYSWEFWQLRILNGKWVMGTSAVYDLSGPGVIPQSSGRASGFSLLSGLIWPQELLATNIPHALVFVFHTKKGNPVWPALHSDGPYTEEAAMPMGTHIQLDPALELTNLGLDRYQIAIGKALQEYGAYLGDTGSFAFKCVSPRSYASDPYAPIPSYDRSSKIIKLDKIPANRFRVLKLGAVQSNYNILAHPELYY